MSDIAIRVEGLSKRYKIGTRGTHADELRGRLATAATAPFRRLFRRNGASSVQSPESRAQSNGPSPPGGERLGEGGSCRLTTENSPSLTPDTRHPTLDNVLWALKDVSFEVKQGEILGIIGRNGAGKSTLLKILSRITEPTAGRAEILGRIAALLEVGTGFHPELTGRENVYLNGSILGLTKGEIDHHFDAIVDFSGVEKFIDTPVKRYSSGMHVRLGFAVAAHLQPEILLVDEVLAVGDVAFQRKCLGKMEGVARSGRTVFFVSHNMAAIRQLCQRAIWLESGRIRQDGDSDDIVNEYFAEAGKTDGVGDLQKQIAQLPNDPLFRLREIEILQDGVPATNVISGKPVEIILDYEVFESTDGLHVYFELRDLDDTLLFESLHNGADEGIPSVSAGRYESRVVIPADFLAPRPYTLRFWAGVHNVRALFPAPIAVPLTVEPSGRVNCAYPGYRTPGRLAPLLPWCTEKLES